jgi:hypothetical protein
MRTLFEILLKTPAGRGLLGDVFVSKMPQTRVARRSKGANF